MKKAIMIIIALLALVLAACAPQAKNEITLGVITTLSGDAATYGLTEQHATDLAVEDINAAGGINGKLLRVIYEDSKCNAKDGLTAATKLLDVDNVKVILGGFCSSETLGVAPLTEQRKVILFSAFSSSPEITKAGDYVFRLAPSDAEGGVTAADLIASHGHKKIALISEQTDYSQAVRRVFEAAAQKQGITIVADETYPAGETDFRTYLTKIRETQPDAVFINPQTSAGGFITKQARELGISTPLYSTFVFNNADTITTAGKAAEGLYFTDAPTITETNLKGKAFLNRYMQRFDKPAHDFGAALDYDRVHIIANALKQCGEDTTCIKNALYNVNAYDGTAGTYGFDENGDVTGIHFVVRKIENGIPVLVSD